MGDRARERLAAVAFLFPAPEIASAVLEPSTARDRHAAVDRHYSGFESDSRRRKLPGGSRRISALNHFIEQRPARICIELPPVIGRNAAGKPVWIEAWRAVKSEDGTGVRLEGDRSAL